MDLVIPLFSLILPFILWPVEYIFPYPFLVEELAKLVVVLYILKTVEDDSLKIKITIASGVFFALSELVIYIFNIQLVGGVDTIFVRLILTIPLHVITYLLILIPGMKDIRYAYLGVILAMAIHFIFNFALSQAVIY